MARPIAPTPKLDQKATERFLARVERDLKRPAYPIPTPRLAGVVEKIMEDQRMNRKGCD